MATQEDISSLQAPLVFGVTGHRDLRDEDIAALEQKVRDIFDDFRAKYPSTPFLLLSPLAEGADRLVARVALGSGARLIAPLPLPQSLYETDFETPESIAQFRELLASADESFALDLLANEDTVRPKGPLRDKEYEKVGKYIARESQVLIALWDGTDPAKVGGTAAIVRFQTEGPDRGPCDLFPPELFPVYHIITPRVSNGKTPIDALQLKVRYPSAFKGNDDGAKDYYHTIFQDLDEFNCEMAKGGRALASQADSCGRPALSEPARRTMQQFAYTDALAIQFQSQVRSADIALHWIVFFSFLFFVLFAHLDEHPVSFLFISAVLLGLAIFVHRYSKSKRLEDRFLDYRAIAEGCRVRLFWQVAGVHDSVADNYLGKQRTELDWIRNGLRGWSNGKEYRREMGTTTEPLQHVISQWVEKQKEYFEGARESNWKKFERKELESKICLWIAVGTGLLLLLFQLLAPQEFKEERWRDIPVIAIDAFLAAGALLHHYKERQAYAEHKKQYDRMHAIFSNALDSLERIVSSDNFKGAQDCLRKLGKEALVENGDWVLLHRERPLELPHP